MEIKVEGYRVVQVWDDGETETAIEIKVVDKDGFGQMVEVGSSLTQIPKASWPVIRDKINKLFREME